VNPPRNRKGETGSPPPNVNASEFYPNHPIKEDVKKKRFSPPLRKMRVW
jgi:hypothetical protein